MGAPSWVRPLQALIDNPLPPITQPAFIGLIGDHPSKYAKSPGIWRPALEAFSISASYLPLDIRADRLEAVLALLKETEACLGANVTTPYKEAVLTQVDPSAEATAIGAVNTIVRLRDGRLHGANTDGAGMIAALHHDDGNGPLVRRLDGTRVLLLGAGGAGRAAALTLAPLVVGGEVIIINRTHERALALARIVRASGGRATALLDEELDNHLPSVDLVINASLRGQEGIRKSPQGWTTLERYSPLAPAGPIFVQTTTVADFYRVWERQAAADVAANNARARARARCLPADAVVFDMIYAPRTTPLVAHAREAGLRTANGRWMNIAQAAAAFSDHICRDALARAARGGPAAARGQVEEIMAAAWGE